ncbi:hypothetical protein FIBSPDRAFT_915450 [Athelia psychrophila]|uniref:Uncharacterized protein n=1 Tax=Athelia psychrophila TaxID=1759441 RepID=A0A167TB41_9AGAM|nr:hypothetical protein FIBSPDRAFT_915450 [Fibularhizoctonia sp. CBS 109695]
MATSSSSPPSTSTFLTLYITVFRSISSFATALSVLFSVKYAKLPVFSPTTASSIVTTAMRNVCYKVISITGTTVNIGISTDWDGAISNSTGCANDGSTCTAGGPLGAPVPGPDSSCYSSYSDSVAGALPAGGGGCTDNAGPGRTSPSYTTLATTPTHGANGYTSADNFDYTCDTCDNTAITLPPPIFRNLSGWVSWVV